MSKADYFQKIKRAQVRGKIPGLGSVVFKALDGMDYIEYAELQQKDAPLFEVACFVVERGIFQKGVRVFADGEHSAKGKDCDQLKIIGWMNKILMLSGADEDPAKP